jgi:low temperature requirement protein LtrA
VAIGVGAVGGGGGRALSAELVLAVSLGLLITVGMWWTYFDRFAAAAEERLREHEDPVLAASDGYSYLHLVIVAGIITFAVGVKLLVSGAVGSPMHAGARLALCGGVALYLVGHVAFRARMVGSVGYQKLVAAAALLVLFATGDGLPAWAMAGAVAAVTAVLCAAETVPERSARWAPDRARAGGG